MSYWKDFSNWGQAMAYYKKINAHEIRKGGKGWIVVKYVDQEGGRKNEGFQKVS